MSEDPFLAGELAASYVSGVQSKNVGVSVKHFAANNQEYHRMSTDVVVRERALHEIYLAAFETAVKKAHPWTLMCAYNQINGTYCCENKWLLTDVLREEWGFDGVVMSDWGATNNRVNALAVGLELEMPYSYGFTDREIVAAVKCGMLPESVLDTAVERLLQWINKGLAEEPVVELLHVSGPQATRLLKKLVDEGSLRCEGIRNTAKYHLNLGEKLQYGKQQARQVTNTRRGLSIP